MAMGLRQQPGLACEECRRRKARCDRARPQCGTCEEAGTACIVVDKRPQRGPKKGQLKALRTRVATLERHLVSPNTLIPNSTSFSEWEHSMNMSMDTSAVPIVESYEELHEPPEPLDLASVTSDPALCTEWSDSGLMSPGITASSKPLTPSPIQRFGDWDMSDLMWADLDQLYFDRVHAVAPILHKRRYFAWAGQENPSPARAGLRSAMRIIAAAASAQFRQLNDALYAETRRMLEKLDVSEHGNIQLEQVQAWLLLAHYEFLRMQEHQAMLTAGFAFRLVQLSRLCDVDAPGMSPTDCSSEIPPDPSISDELFAEVEEKRRTFWLAFSFDRFLSTHNEWPLTLHEEMICVRLPAPEVNFQNSQPIRMAFLSEAIADNSRSTLSPYAECMVLATLYGRCMTHRRLTLTAAISGKESRDFWTRHELLASTVEKRTQLFLRGSPAMSAIVERDTMLVYIHMLAHSAVVHLSQTIETTPWQAVEHQLMAITYKQHAYKAATEIVDMAKAVPQLSCFKVHPFSPIALSRAASFLITYARLSDLADSSDNPNDGVDYLLGALRHLKDVNNLAQDLLSKIEMEITNITSNFLVPY